MNLKLHHVNLSSPIVPEMNAFYRNVLGLAELEDGAAPNRIRTDAGYAAPVAFLEAGRVEMHLAATDIGLNFRMNHAINPLLTGHIAFRADDIDDVKRRLDRLGVNYSDYGEWSVKGWYQIFLHDPAGNVIEVHQVVR